MIDIVVDGVLWKIVVGPYSGLVGIVGGIISAPAVLCIPVTGLDRAIRAKSGRSWAIVSGVNDRGWASC